MPELLLGKYPKWFVHTVLVVVAVLALWFAGYLDVPAILDWCVEFLEKTLPKFIEKKLG